MMSLTSVKIAQRGIALLEVLITIFILTFGLLGLAGLHVRLQEAGVESYQRSQALILLNNMASRITTNRNAAASYVTPSPLGTGGACTNATTTLAQRDAGEWCNALQGASEISGVDKVGAMIGGRGCVEGLGSGQYMVTVAWQGLMPVSAPPVSVSCGANLYDSSAVGANCINDLCRRTITTIVQIATLPWPSL